MFSESRAGSDRRPLRDTKRQAEKPWKVIHAPHSACIKKGAARQRYALSLGRKNRRNCLRESQFLAGLETEHFNVRTERQCRQKKALKSGFCSRPSAMKPPDKKRGFR